MIGPGVAGGMRRGADGLHVREDHFLAEVVDPETGAPLPDGEVGELVFTTLTKEALPMLRYRTGDLARLTREPCVCGRTHRADGADLGPHRRHADHPRRQRLPLARSSAPCSRSPELAPHYQLVVERPGHLDELTVEAELRERETGGERLEAFVAERLGRALGLTARVRLGPPGSVPRSEGKALRVLDRRDT